MSNQPILSVSNLTVRLNRQTILKDVNFEIREGETLAIIGPNGSGKTTLFRALLGIIPFQGTVTWRENTKIGYVPQRLSIEPDLPFTTIELLELKEKNRKKMMEVLNDVGFQENKPHVGHLAKHILNQKVGRLSGGELQRILIAWALLGNPNVLLFDEPTSGIDVSAEESVYALLRRLQEHQKLTVLLISHELQVVYRYATNVVCLNKEQLCFGPPLNALSRENLEKVFGADVGVYHHHRHGSDT